MIEQVNFDKCPEAVEAPPENTDKKYLPCEACGKFFEHSGRGRPPKSCAWARKNTKARDKKLKKARKKARKDDNYVEVAVFEPLPADVDLKVGDVVYYYSKSIRDIIARQYASSYKVIKIEEDGVPLIERATKTSHREHPIRLEDPTRVFKKIGVEYVDKTEEEEDSIEEGTDQ